MGNDVKLQRCSMDCMRSLIVGGPLHLQWGPALII